MGAIEDIKAKGLPYHDDESGLIRLAILDLAARLDKLTERVGELELASPCPMLKSICEDWEYIEKLDGTERIKIPISQPKFGPLLNDAKPAPDEEMVERYAIRICEEASVKHPNKLVEALVDFRNDILRQFVAEVRR